MKVGIHGSGDQRTVDTCKRLGVNQVCLVMDCSKLAELDFVRDQKLFLARHGISSPCAFLGVGHYPSAAVIAGDADAGPELETARRAMQNLGEAGFYSAVNFISALCPSSEKEEAEHWGRLLDYYEKLVRIAEEVGVRIATHAWYYPDRLVRNSEHLLRIVNGVRSDFNGVTFCAGLYIPGDDVPGSVELFRGRVFFAHARDLRGSGARSAEETVEVPLGRGDVNLPGMVEALQRVGYGGIICPEHLGPEVPGTDQLADAVRYLRKLVS